MSGSRDTVAHRCDSTKVRSTCRDRRGRVLFVHSGYLGWRTYSATIRLLVTDEPRVNARFVEPMHVGSALTGTLRRRRSPQWLRLPVRLVRRYGLGTLSYLRSARGFEPDVVHAAGHLMAAAPLLLRTEATLIVTLDATALQIRDTKECGRSASGRVLEPLLRWAEAWILERCAQVHCTSEWSRRSVVDDFGIAPHKVSVTPQFVFGPEKSRLDKQLVERFGAETVNLAFVGNDFARKGGELLLDAYREHLVGKATLHVFSGDPSLRGRVVPGVFFHGDVDNAALLRDMLPTMDALVLPTLFDQTPVAVLEALACALPVVAFDVGGMRELVADGVTGRLVPAGEEAALGIVLAGLVADRAARETMSRAARAAFLDRFDADSAGREFVSSIAELGMSTRDGGSPDALVP